MEIFPEWEQSIIADRPIRVRVPSPLQSELPDTWLESDTSDGDVVVAYDRYHTHFDVTDEGLRNALDFIRAFIDEQLCILVTMAGEKTIGSISTKPAEGPGLTWLPSHTAWHPGNRDRVYRRSWKGTFDKDYRVSTEEEPLTKDE